MPDLQGGEWDYAYGDRLARWNGFKTRAVTKRAAREYLRIALGRDQRFQWVKYVSALRGEPLESLMNRHCLLWFIRTGPPDQKAASPDAECEGAPQRVVCSPIGRSAWLCPRCVANDLAEKGFSWWRRDHQMPGAVSCSVHRCALGCLDEVYACAYWRPSAMMEAPSQVLKRTSNELAEDSLVNPYVQRYESLLRHILKEPAPVVIQPIAQAIQWRLEWKLRPGGVQDRDLAALSKEVLLRFPLDWLRYFFCKSGDSDLSGLEIGHSPRGYKSQALSVPKLLLTACLVYVSAAETIQDWTSSLQLYRCRIPASPKIDGPL